MDSTQTAKKKLLVWGDVWLCSPYVLLSMWLLLHILDIKFLYNNKYYTGYIYY